MVEPRRGEVWWVRLDPTLGSEIAKTRPCVIVSGNVFNRLRRTVVVLPLSTAPPPSRPLAGAGAVRRPGRGGGHGSDPRDRQTAAGPAVWESCCLKTWRRLSRGSGKFSNCRPHVIRRRMTTFYDLEPSRQRKSEPWNKRSQTLTAEKVHLSGVRYPWIFRDRALTYGK